MPTLRQLVTLLCASKGSIKRIVNRTASKLQANLEKYEDDRITKKTFTSRSKKILSEAYRSAYKAGSGVSGVSDAGEEWLGNHAASQFGFLEGFADDIEAGVGTMEFDSRMGLYAKAIQPAYWGGSVLEASRK